MLIALSSCQANDQRSGGGGTTPDLVVHRILAKAARILNSMAARIEQG
jgi:hypothetical protein